MRKTRRHIYGVSFGRATVLVHATSYGNAVAKARRTMRWPNLGSDPDTGGFIGYSVETPADRKD